MKKGCRNCKFNEKVTDEQKAYALKVQAIMAKPILNRDKNKEIEGLPEHERFSHLPGLKELTYNDLPIEIQGVDIYRVCMNDKNNLMGSLWKEGARTIHKTYFVCEHWEAEND